ncbi:unnamed protein product [Closterium sp. NIES-54]
MREGRVPRPVVSQNGGVCKRPAGARRSNWTRHGNLTIHSYLGGRSNLVRRRDQTGGSNRGRGQESLLLLPPLLLLLLLLLMLLLPTRACVKCVETKARLGSKGGKRRVSDTVNTNRRLTRGLNPHTYLLGLLQGEGLLLLLLLLLLVLLLLLLLLGQVPRRCPTRRGRQTRRWLTSPGVASTGGRSGVTGRCTRRLSWSCTPAATSRHATPTTSAANASTAAATCTLTAPLATSTSRPRRSRNSSCGHVSSSSGERGCKGGQLRDSAPVELWRGHSTRGGGYGAEVALDVLERRLKDLDSELTRVLQKKRVTD